MSRIHNLLSYYLLHTPPIDIILFLINAWKDIKQDGKQL